MKRSRLKSLLIILVAGIGVAVIVHEDTNSGWCQAPLRDFQLYQSPLPAEDIPMLTADGVVFRLSDLKGQVVLLNFWRKDCPYCVQEKAFLRSMSRSIGSSNLKIVCANFWDSPAWVKSYGRNAGPEIVVAARPSDALTVMENVAKGRFMGYFILNEAKEAVYEVKGFPSTYVIDRQGFVVASHLGMAKWSSGSVQKWLRTLLDDPRQREPYPDGTEKLERLLMIKPQSDLPTTDVSRALNQQRPR